MKADCNHSVKANLLWRIGEMSKLFVEATLFSLAAFIHPFGEDRDSVRAMMEPGGF